jgi:hypothetical protein
LKDINENIQDSIKKLEIDNILMWRDEVACHNFQEISSLQKKELIPGIVRKLL